MGVINAILEPLEYIVAWIMVAWHKLFTLVGLPEASGLTWALSIVGLVIVIRILLIPLFVKQIKASRGLQLLQPEMKKIQQKYKGKSDQASKEAMTREMMALYKHHGTNPLSSCMPLLLQSPIFFALFRVLNGIPNERTVGPLDAELVRQADAATLFGAPLSDTFLKADTLSTQVLTVVLIILMSLTTFTTQRQLMQKNMPASAMEGQFAQQQKIMLYVLPLVFAVSGVNFPIGVLLYWLTTNLWSMGQQFYVIRRMPAPGSLAEQALNARRQRAGKAPLSEAGSPSSTVSEPGTGTADSAPERATPQRQQPKRQPRSKRGSPQRPGGRPSQGQKRPDADAVGGS
ncbi:MAG: membrane protein insertase YidC [Kineosporiaceae bacterium]|nr:membrane protein insertase YidC [Kineosporiaceae bacterium]